jgi:hypothetical protein
LVIIIIIIIIGKTVVFEPQHSLEYFAKIQNAFCFQFFGFRNNDFLQSKIVSLASNLKPGGSKPSIYVPQ